MNRSLIFMSFLGLLSSEAHAVDLYVDGANGSWAGTGTKQSPFLTGYQAWQAAQPGDTIHLLPTATYSVEYFQNKSGTASKPITITGDGQFPALTKIVGRDQYGANFSIGITGDNYINIKNLEFDGQYQPGDPETLECVSVQNSSHINVTNNYIHNCGGSGIGSMWSDYLNFSYNTVTQSAANTATYRGSGISTNADADVDGNTGTKIYIISNIIYNNSNVPVAPCASTACSNDTDGSGIILDDSKRYWEPGSTIPPYHGKTLVANNVIYNNGGRGITTFETDHVMILNNTLFHNNQDPYEASYSPGEISVVATGDIQIYNNVLYGDDSQDNNLTGTHVSILVCNTADTAGPVTVDYNLIYNQLNQSTREFAQFGNTNKVTFGTHNSWGDPLFVQASSNPLLANFYLQPTSLANGTAYAPMTIATDIFGNSRRSAPPDRGAIQ